MFRTVQWANQDGGDGSISTNELDTLDLFSAPIIGGNPLLGAGDTAISQSGLNNVYANSGIDPIAPPAPTTENYWTKSEFDSIFGGMFHNTDTSPSNSNGGGSDWLSAITKSIAAVAPAAINAAAAGKKTTGSSAKAQNQAGSQGYTGSGGSGANTGSSNTLKWIIGGTLGVGLIITVAVLISKRSKKSQQ